MNWFYDADRWPDLFLSAGGDNRLYRNLGGARFEDGRLHLSETPGFGIEIDWDYVEHARE